MSAQGVRSIGITNGGGIHPKGAALSRRAADGRQASRGIIDIGNRCGIHREGSRLKGRTAAIDIGHLHRDGLTNLCLCQHHVAVE